MQYVGLRAAGTTAGGNQMRPTNDASWTSAAPSMIRITVTTHEWTVLLSNTVLRMCLALKFWDVTSGVILECLDINKKKVNYRIRQ
jgi:hypothetical protein